MSDLSILLTEDDADVARYLSTVLKSLGHKVAAVAPDGAQAVKLAQELNPGLVIMDIDLPGMNGVAAARKILEKQSVPLIISTGRTDSEALESTRELDIQAFLIKPFSAVQLKSAIAVALSQHRMQAEARKKISELSGALEAVQDKADGGALTQERLQTLGLTPREAEVMAWVAQGKSNSDIATILVSSPRTVAKHIEHVFAKLNVESRTAAVAEARRLLQQGVAD
ncbi:MAG: DNA-binding response regulator [Chthoniobacteraceae bacterium]|nr:DNA-binding response regulator [Chthoniobacteraceae bacterium]